MRWFLLCSLIISGFVTLGQVPAAAGKARANQQRLEQRIFELARFGRDAKGHGYRVAYSQGDIEGRAWFIGEMKKAGLDVTIDYAGNIIGRRKGRRSTLPAIAFGSHIDMVPDGGNYDGCVGSIGALEVIELLNENKIVTNHPLEVIIFSNEEGGTVGSMAMAGHLKPEGLKIVSQSGLTIGEGTRAIGGNPDSILLAARKKGDLKAFLELHIEQGGLLDKEKVEIGVVEGIVGIEHWMVNIKGFANHAGTTPMNMRRDAALAAAKLIVAVNEVVTSYDGRQVGTVGMIAVQPGAYNVIPGQVSMGLEIRDLSYDKIWQLFRDIEKRAAAIEKETGTTISFDHQANPSKPALTDRGLQNKILQAARSLGLTQKFMQSGAGHDSQEIALIAPVGMIFIPSVEGISHSPKEFSKAVDMANGVNVLLQTVLALDGEK